VQTGQGYEVNGVGCDIASRDYPSSTVSTTTTSPLPPPLPITIFPPPCPSNLIPMFTHDLIDTSIPADVRDTRVSREGIKVDGMLYHCTFPFPRGASGC
jgi:hypothetical protein